MCQTRLSGSGSTPSLSPNLCRIHGWWSTGCAVANLLVTNAGPVNPTNAAMRPNSVICYYWSVATACLILSGDRKLCPEGFGFVDPSPHSMASLTTPSSHRHLYPKNKRTVGCLHAFKPMDSNKIVAAADRDETKVDTIENEDKNNTEPAGGGPFANRRARAAVTAIDASLAESSPLSSSMASPNASSSKLRQLKDLMWVRETLEDCTAGEFACTVELQQQGGQDEQSRRQRRKRAVDYGKLLARLNRRLRDIGCLMTSEDGTEGSAVLKCKLQPNTGMGTLTYNAEQRGALLERILRTRQQLMDVIQGSNIEVEAKETSVSFLKLPELPELPRMELPKENVEDVSGPKLYVRDDGTVDWDGALQDKAALRKFGTAVWARINGREDDAAAAPTQQAVTAKIAETPEIRRVREQLEKLQNDLSEQEKSHYRLLNSAISQGQATANVKLASLEPLLRGKIQESAERLETLKIRVSFQTLVYELERIFTYLMGELGNPSSKGYIPLQDRLNVAEFGLLESQMDSFHQQFVESEMVDEDVLAVVFEQLTDFKRRLGIDYFVTGLSFDREAISRYINELWMKTKNGLAFYVKGVQLFWNDILFCLRLINKAAQGYTLKPREVRTLRRTFKDVITFIPFVIILLIPLTPIGHILIFGAIQRIFPDFFPSCFTEQRQNLLQLYETAEYSELTIHETWAKKISRLVEATLYMAANAMRNTYYQVTGQKKSGPEQRK